MASKQEPLQDQVSMSMESVQKTEQRKKEEESPEGKSQRRHTDDPPPVRYVTLTQEGNLKGMKECAADANTSMTVCNVPQFREVFEAAQQWNAPVSVLIQIVDDWNEAINFWQQRIGQLKESVTTLSRNLVTELSNGLASAMLNALHAREIMKEKMRRVRHKFDNLEAYIELITSTVTIESMEERVRQAGKGYDKIRNSWWKIELLLETMNFSVIQRAEWRRKGLSTVAKEGDLQGVRYLVKECEADVHAREEEALQHASLCGHLKVVKYLVEKGMANAHVYHELPLQSAARNGHVKLVRYLVEVRGADIRAHGQWALTYSCVGGHLEVVRYLVEKGADVHAKNEHAVRSAMQSGCLELVQYLVEKGANVHAKDHHLGQNALQVASWHGHLELVRYLVEKCEADAHADDDYALHLAKSGEHHEVVRYLLKKTRSGQSFRDLEVVQFLV